MKKQYIQAVLEMIAEGKEPSAILSGLSKAMGAKGHSRLLASVLAGVLRILETQKSKGKAVVTVAEEKAVTKYSGAIKQALTDLGISGKHEIRIDDTIIGGFTTEFNNVFIDNSYKAQLVALYRKLAK